jgi:alpha-L-rhamnosidase
MKGGGEETYHPRHTFFGFRYAELTATGDVEVKHLEGQVVGSDIKEWGRFECSNTDINRLYQNIWWSQRGNFLSIPTDCPQRDERLGWTGDTQIFSVTALYNSDVKDFYRKWMRDLRNGQREDGSYPCTAPFANMWGYGGSAWGDAGIIVPYNVYSMTGDKQILEENYESMQRWVEHCAEQREGDWTHIGAETDFGDWLAYKQLDKRFVSYAYYAHICHLMWRISCTLNKGDHEKYLHLRENIIDEFQRRGIDVCTVYDGKTICFAHPAKYDIADNRLATIGCNPSYIKDSTLAVCSWQKWRVFRFILLLLLVWRCYLPVLDKNRI